MGDTTTLFRPVGQIELELIVETGWSAFPPRLDWQPIFYPVLNRAYAETIARDWNTKDAANGSVGYVLRFSAPAGSVDRYPPQRVGDVEHQELWISAADLAEFNRHIVDGIHLVATFVRVDDAGVQHSGLTQRVTARVLRDFGRASGRALGLVAAARLHDGLPPSERVTAAAVLFGGGDLDRLGDACRLAGIDERDVLVMGRLANGDWPERIDDEFGRSANDGQL